MLFGISGTYTPAILFIGAGLIILRTLPTNKWSVIDWILTLATVYAMLSPIYSLCRIPAFDTASLILFLWGAYLFFRTFFSVRQHSPNLIINAYGIVSCCAAAIAIVTFILCVSGARQLGFCDLYPLRYLYHPLGFTNNLWGEIAILLTGFSFLLTRCNGIAVYLTSMSAMLTFSRGTYISLLLLFLTLLLFLRPILKYRSAIAGMLFAAISIGIFFPTETLTTFSMVRTSSQQDSLEWRQHTTCESMKLALKRPFFGSGNGTYTLITNGAKINGIDGTFTNFAPNIFSQISIENGLTGILILLMFCIAIIIYIIRNHHKPRVVIVGGIFLALLAKEMAQATLSHSLPAQFLVITLLAYLQKDTSIGFRSIEKNQWWKGRIIGYGWLICTIILVIFPKEIIRDYDSASISKSMAHLKSGNIYRALKELEYTSSRLRDVDPNINRLLTYLYIRNNQLNDATAMLASAHSFGGIDLWLEGECEYYGGNKDKASAIWAESIYLTPSLLNTSEFNAIQLADSKISGFILKSIESKKNPSRAVEKARYGYIIHHIGNKETAKRILSNAISEYPTLRTPHLLLGDTAIYDFLQNGSLFYSTHTARDNPMGASENDKTNLLKLILDNYALPLREWYSINIDNL